MAVKQRKVKQVRFEHECVLILRVFSGKLETVSQAGGQGQHWTRSK